MTCSGLTLSVLDFLHLDFVMLLHSLVCYGSFLLVYGMA